MRVLVIDNYDSFTYNLVQYLGELGAEVQAVRNDRAERRRAARRRLRALRDLARARAPPTRPASPSRSPAACPKRAIPTLGVCLGHQSMAQAFGGKVKLHAPVHGKATTIEHDGRTIFAACPRR